MEELTSITESIHSDVVKEEKQHRHHIIIMAPCRPRKPTTDSDGAATSISSGADLEWIAYRTAQCFRHQRVAPQVALALMNTFVHQERRARLVGEELPLDYKRPLPPMSSSASSSSTSEVPQCPKAPRKRRHRKHRRRAACTRYTDRRSAWYMPPAQPRPPRVRSPASSASSGTGGDASDAPPPRLRAGQCVAGPSGVVCYRQAPPPPSCVTVLV
jgi:hypothetical protein